MINRALFIIVLAAFASCGSSEEKSLEEVRKVESVLFGTDKNFKFDANVAREVINLYDNFVRKHPKSKEAPEMLLKSADLHRSMKNYNIAISVYEKIESDYPEFEKLAQVVFLQGFVFENELGKLDKAKERYEYFLKKYPDHELAKDVTFSLQHLGKSPEDIIREFEQKSADIQDGSDPS